MNVPIIFQSLDRINGKEGRSKLLHSEHQLYTVLHQIKQVVSKQYQVGDDRMDLHIEITKNRRDPDFRIKAESIQDEVIDLANANNWVYLGRAFVLMTPKVDGYGDTHITIAFFGRYPKPSIDDLRTLVMNTLDTLK